MAPATRSQSRKTRSAGANTTTTAKPAAAPKAKKASAKKASGTKRGSQTEEETAAVDSVEHTQKKQKLANGDGNAKSIANDDSKDDVEMKESPAEDSGKDVGSAEESTPTSSEEEVQETPEAKEEEKPQQEQSQQKEEQPQQKLDAEPKSAQQPEIKKETVQTEKGISNGEQRPEVKPEDIVDDSALLSGESAPILERGLFYMFARNRIDVQEASAVNDIQRSYLVLHPYPPTTMPKEDAEDVKNIKSCRVLMFPKKKLPGISSHEREIALVDLCNASIDEVREDVLKGYSYDTKTKGERTVQAAQPIAEGVYALTQGEKDRNSHFAYIRTFPEGSNEVAENLGIHDKGSFLLSARNPKFPPPGQIKGLPGVDEYPKDVQEEFGDLRWTAAHPEHLNVKNAQILWIGEKSQLAGATEEDKETVEAELGAMEKDESKGRIPQLKKKDTNPIHNDLELMLKDEFLKTIKTSWSA